MDSIRSNKPKTAAQLVLKQQTEILLEVLATPPEDPYHHIIFNLAYTDRISEIPMRLKQLLNTPHFHGFLVTAPMRATIFPLTFSHLRARQE